MIGILAYGSLISDPGEEISQAIMQTIDDVQTPFEVEYARSSKGRAGAPTLAPVPPGKGGSVLAKIFVLKPEISEQDAQDMLYRRETNQVGNPNKTYPADQKPGGDRITLPLYPNLAGIEKVFSTEISANIPEILDEEFSIQEKAEVLAKLAVESLTKETFPAGRDGIQYLLDNLNAGIKTPLSADYQAAVLAAAGDAPDLAEARRRIAKQKGILQ